MNITAVIMARDEAHILDRCLRSLSGHVERVVLVDTGSTDETVEMSRDLGVDVFEQTWVDFGHNRTAALNAARQLTPPGEYVLMLDADMTVVESVGEWESDLPVYQVRVNDGGPGYHLPLLTRGDQTCGYVGSTHEYLDHLTTDRYEGLTVLHHCDGARRSAKFTNDLELLTIELERDPDNPRTVFYLANSLRDLGRHAEALPLYRRRATMGGWQAEAEKAALQALRIEAGDFTPVGVPSP